MLRSERERGEGKSWYHTRTWFFPSSFLTSYYLHLIFSGSKTKCTWEVAWQKEAAWKERDTGDRVVKDQRGWPQDARSGRRKSLHPQENLTHTQPPIEILWSLVFAFVLRGCASCLETDRYLWVCGQNIPNYTGSVWVIPLPASRLILFSSSHCTFWGETAGNAAHRTHTQTQTHTSTKRWNVCPGGGYNAISWKKAQRVLMCAFLTLHSPPSLDVCVFHRLSPCLGSRREIGSKTPTQTVDASDEAGRRWSLHTKGGLRK